ncbi:hypothetical protein ABZP36_034170 [Zizania latifolia]
MAILAPMAAAAAPLTMAFLLLLLMGVICSVSHGQLEVGFYSDSCPDAEDIVTGAVQDAAASDPTILPALLRLQFHDCFVRGCDASVLIRSARNDAETGGPSFDVPTGRRDGLESNLRDADVLPDVIDSIEVLRSRFAASGLDDRDLVVLTAAHTIGTTACFFVKDRLYNYRLPGGGVGSDPSIPPAFVMELKARCAPGDFNTRVALDRGSERDFDDSILRNIRQGLAVIASDAALDRSNATRALVTAYLGAGSSRFSQDFVDSMVKMGSIGALTGDDGEIRDVCSEFNSN